MTGLEQIQAEGLIETNGSRCTYCREEKPDCRPAPVYGREFIPALCDECFDALRLAGRHDVERDHEVFHP